VTDKLSIEEHLVLSATAPWVDTPELLLLHHNGRRWVCCQACCPLSTASKGSVPSSQHTSHTCVIS
jgi:hypothetical protein